MNEFVYYYTCTCSEGIKRMTFGKKEDAKILKEDEFELMTCSECHTHLKLKKIVQILKNNQLVNQEG